MLNTTSKNILDIALESGFSDLRYMTEVFREKFGCTPTEYRRLHPVLTENMHSSAENLQELLNPEESLHIIQKLSDTSRLFFDDDE